MDLLQLVNSKKDEIFELGEKLFRSPELGYKEFKTKAILSDYFNAHHLTVQPLGFQTAFCVSIGKGKPHIGLIAELDAVPTINHPFANIEDNYAAHSCGHSTQCTIMASALVLLKELKPEQGTITLFFTPAEEFTDVEYRKELIREEKINYIGGKVNMLAAHQFDDVDMFIHLHTQTDSRHDITINSSLAGFVYKRIHFMGKAAHAAVCPEKGINALEEFIHFYERVEQLKSNQKEKDLVRIHGIIVNGGQSVNVIPEEVVYECYVRAGNNEVLLSLSDEVDQIAKDECAKMGGKAIIEEIPGYLPLLQSKPLNDIIDVSAQKFTNAILRNHPSVAAGDVGDISVFKPIVQFGYGGFDGACHSKDLCIADPNKAYLLPCAIVLDSVMTLFRQPEKAEQIVRDFKPRMGWENYISYINKMN